MIRTKDFFILLTIVFQLLFTSSCSKMGQEKVYYTIDYDINGTRNSYTETRREKQTKYDGIFGNLESYWPGGMLNYKFNLNEMTFWLFADGIVSVSVLYYNLDSTSISSGKVYSIIDELTTKEKFQLQNTQYYPVFSLWHNSSKYHAVSGHFCFNKTPEPKSNVSFTFFFDGLAASETNEDTIIVSNGRIDIYKSLCSNNSHITDGL